MQNFKDHHDEFGVSVRHHMPDDGSGVYIKEVVIPAGVVLGMHAHSFTHKSALCSGRVRLTTDGCARELNAPVVLHMPQGVSHQIEALTPAVWLCIHATDEDDAEKIDSALMDGGL